MACDARQTILVVEDEALIRMHGVDILESEGFDVLEAETADEAVALLDTHNTIHLLFSDIDMPGSMDGIELARLVHARWPNIGLLLTSGHREVPEGTLPDHGRFVRKPWTEAMLVEKIRATLAAGR
jgi:CheY-like chemotaxis protein